jgi:hypothetical protein
MATYKYSKYLTVDSGTEFDAVHKPGADVPYSGIYRCAGCGKSSTNVKGHTVPTQNHHQHTAQQGDIRWQLVVMSHWA